eukprot:TRINITY_DN23495_c0_g1_i1.p1 TRINITY_DN23495_c0_g1~~TRINITY_DN23495_c0_g1_i1.p1  ORF type:complete len:110 (-),score=3.27 TRINITY_DN23495_c0_g1_i1:79-408(-)
MNEPVFLRDFQFDKVHHLLCPVSHSLNCGNQKMTSNKIQEQVREYYRPHRMYEIYCLFYFPSFRFIFPLLAEIGHFAMNQQDMNPTINTPQRIDFIFDSFKGLTTFSMD